MLDLVARDFPSLYPYARMAYGNHTWLYFGEHRIVSQSGVQQGCPLGPLFFSLLMADARSRAHDLMKERHPGLGLLDFEAWYLDDGTVAGPMEVVIAYIEALEEACASVNLRFNRAKCEVISNAEEVLPPFFDDTAQHTVDDFELLGVPCGNDESVIHACTLLADKVGRRLARVAQLADPQVVFSLLRHCGGFPLSNFLARAAGTLGRAAFADIDDAVLDAFQKGVTDIPDAVAREALRLPAGRGGMGLRSAEDSAPLAFIGAVVAARALRHHLVTDTCAERLDASPDQRVEAALAAPEIADAPAVHALAVDLIHTNPPAEGDGRAVKQQRELQGRRDQFLTDSVLERASPELRTRMLSGSTKHASAWLCPLAGAEDPLWIDAAIFVSLVRQRYACPLQPDYSDCQLCGKRGVCDPLGSHTTKCLGTGAKWYVHNIVRDVIMALSAEALLSPAAEPTNALLSTTQRPDVIMKMHGGPMPTYVCLDVTVASADASAHRAAAARIPGGAALRAQEEKHAKYGAAARAAGFPFLGVAFDNFGATSPDAASLIKMIAIAWGRRSNLSASRAIPLVATVVMTALMTAIGRLLLRNSAPTARARDYVPFADVESALAVGRIPNNTDSHNAVGIPLPAVTGGANAPAEAVLPCLVGDDGGASQVPVSQDPDEQCALLPRGAADGMRGQRRPQVCTSERDGLDPAPPANYVAAASVSSSALNIPAHVAGTNEPQVDLACPNAAASAQTGTAPAVAPIVCVEGQAPDPYDPAVRSLLRPATTAGLGAGGHGAWDAGPPPGLVAEFGRLALAVEPSQQERTVGTDGHAAAVGAPPDTCSHGPAVPVCAPAASTCAASAPRVLPVVTIISDETDDDAVSRDGDGCADDDDEVAPPEPVGQGRGESSLRVLRSRQLMAATRFAATQSAALVLAVVHVPVAELTPAVWFASSASACCSGQVTTACATSSTAASSSDTPINTSSLCQQESLLSSSPELGVCHMRATCTRNRIALGPAVSGDVSHDDVGTGCYGHRCAHHDVVCGVHSARLSESSVSGQMSSGVSATSDSGATCVCLGCRMLNAGAGSGSAAAAVGAPRAQLWGQMEEFGNTVRAVPPSTNGHTGTAVSAAPGGGASVVLVGRSLVVLVPMPLALPPRSSLHLLQHLATPLLMCCAHCPSSSPSSLTTVVLRSSAFNYNNNTVNFNVLSSPASGELPATNGGAAAPALQQQVTAGADALVSSGGIGMSSPAGSPSSPMVTSSASLGLRTPSPVAGNTIAGQVCTERTPGGVPASPSRLCAAGCGSGGGTVMTIARQPRGCRSLDVMMLCASVTTATGVSPSPTPWWCGTSSRDLHAKAHGSLVALLSVLRRRRPCRHQHQRPCRCHNHLHPVAAGRSFDGIIDGRGDLRQRSSREVYGYSVALCAGSSGAFSYTQTCRSDLGFRRQGASRQRWVVERVSP